MNIHADIEDFLHSVMFPHIPPMYTEAKMQLSSSVPGARDSQLCSVRTNPSRKSPPNMAILRQAEGDS
jgi:hypothetical protein